MTQPAPSGVMVTPRTVLPLAASSSTCRAAPLGRKRTAKSVAGAACASSSRTRPDSRTRVFMAANLLGPAGAGRPFSPDVLGSYGTVPGDATVWGRQGEDAGGGPTCAAGRPNRP